MRILKYSSGYLEAKAKINRNVSIPLLFLGSMGMICWFFFTLESFIFYISIISLALGGYFFENYTNYRKGIQGEKSVIEALSHLSDEYYLINDVKFESLRGNIDHIVIGPNGIFVIETKNYSGRIICEGDEWVRCYGFIFPREYDIGSPSKQVKRNAVRVKEIIESSGILKDKRVWVEAIVVFTNPDVELEVINPTVPVLTVDKLCEYIKNKKTSNKFSSEEIKGIAQLILAQTLG